MKGGNLIMHETMINDYSFFKYTTISEYRDESGEVNHAIFDKPIDEPPGEGFVYYWLEIGNQSAQIVYVGKAGKRMKNRCSQHTGGFNGNSKSKAGLRNSERICKGIKAGYTYEVYYRKAEVQKVFEVDISMYSTEEEALIKKLDPPWNTLK